MQEDWQQKFNNLLGSNSSKLSPPRSIGVDPASKSSLDHMIHQDAATVSLPRNIQAPTQGRVQDLSMIIAKVITSKPMAEECFDEQEMGSVPQVKLPREAPVAAWHPAKAQEKPLPKRFLVQPSAMEPYRFTAEVVGGGNVVRIQLPGMTTVKTVTIPFSASRGGRGTSGRPNPRGRGGNRGNSRRETSTSRENSSTTSHTGRGGRGNYRSRGSENRNRNTSSQHAVPT
jgi:hypothetical protein